MKAYPSFLVGHNTPNPRKAIVHKMIEVMRQGLNEVRHNGDFLVAKREPDNPYYNKAVAIYTRDPYEKLGYLPQKHHWVADAMDEGTPILVTITDVRKEGFFSKKYYVDLDIIPIRKCKPKPKSTATKKKNTKKPTTRRAKKDWPEFKISASVEIIVGDITFDLKDGDLTRTTAVVFDDTIKAEDAGNAIQRWARKNSRKLEKLLDECDHEELFNSLKVSKVDAEGTIESASFTSNEIEGFIEDGLNTDIEI